MAYEAAKEEAEDRAEKAEQKVLPSILQIFFCKNKVKTLQKAQRTREYIVSNSHQTVTKPYLLPNFLRHQPQQ